MTAKESREKHLEILADKIIFDDENLIGYSWDIFEYVSLEKTNEILNCNGDKQKLEELKDYLDVNRDLLVQLNEHDGLVLCEYHHMGAYVVFDLVVKKED